MFTAMKIPAAFVSIQAVLDDNINTKAILTAIGLMLISTLGKTAISRFSTMLQTEGGYDTAALKRIEIGEHLRYLPTGYFNDTSLGHITSVATNTMEQMGDIATRAIMLVLQGSITTVVIALFMFAFDIRIGIISLAGIGVFILVERICFFLTSRHRDLTTLTWKRWESFCVSLRIRAVRCLFLLMIPNLLSNAVIIRFGSKKAGVLLFSSENRLISIADDN